MAETLLVALSAPFLENYGLLGIADGFDHCFDPSVGDMGSSEEGEAVCAYQRDLLEDDLCDFVFYF